MESVDKDLLDNFYIQPVDQFYEKNIRSSISLFNVNIIDNYNSDDTSTSSYQSKSDLTECLSTLKISDFLDYNNIEIRISLLKNIILNSYNCFLD